MNRISGNSMNTAISVVVNKPFTLRFQLFSFGGNQKYDFLIAVYDPDYRYLFQ